MIGKHRTKKVQLVLLGGKQKTGKTTSAKFIAQILKVKYPTLSVEHTALARPIKEIAHSVFHWDGEKDDRGRRLLQVIGTDAGREYNEDLWNEYLEGYILGGLFIPNIVLVDDWRFPNEKDYFTSRGMMFDVTTIRLYRDTGIIDTHPSENSLPDNKFYYDFVINNNKDFTDLYKELGSVISFLEKNIILDTY